MLIIFVLIILGARVYIGLVLENKFRAIVTKLYFGRIINLPLLSTYFLIPLLNYGMNLVRGLDQGWIEMSGGQGFISRVIIYYNRTDKFNYLNLKLYLFVFLVITISLIFVY